jgi:hypothetical protein
MNVALAMRHFPWLHFQMQGTGRYVHGKDYVVRFTRMPFFAKHFKSIDLSPLDPSMWSKRFYVHLDRAQDGYTVFSLKARRIDPHAQNALTGAVVTLDSHYATRNVNLHYISGYIDISLSPARIHGYRLPSNGNVTINMPGEALSAQAKFSDYVFGPEGQLRQAE